MTEEEFHRLYRTAAGNSFDGHENSHYGFWAQQGKAELWGAIQCAPPNTKRVLEIGVNHGGSLVFWDHLAGSEGITIGIDDGGCIDTQIFSMFRPPHGSYIPVSQLHILQGNSHHPEVIQLVKDIFQEPIDVLIIDGDHTYEGTIMDYETYGPLVRSGGVIIVDDINMGDERVTKAWNEMTGEDKRMTSNKPDAMGIIKV